VESTLAQIDGVVVARVNVVLPERVAPGEPIQPASASVFIKYQPDLDPDSIEPQIRRLVSTSIPGLAGKDNSALSIVFVPAEVYKDHVEMVNLGPFQLTMNQFGTVKMLFLALLVILALVAVALVLKPKIQRRMAAKKGADVTPENA
jgi:type III secretion protein J